MTKDCICTKVPSENPRRPGDGFDGQRTLLTWKCPVHGWQWANQPMRGPILDAWDLAEARRYGWPEAEGIEYDDLPRSVQ